LTRSDVAIEGLTTFPFPFPFVWLLAAHHCAHALGAVRAVPGAGYVAFRKDERRKLRIHTGCVYLIGKYDQAEEVIKRALIIKQNTPGQSVTDIAEVPTVPLLRRKQIRICVSINVVIRDQWLNNLAELHYRKGNYGESLLLQQRSLDINVKTFGQNHMRGRR
jgi:tetratricopeptide (TPR) repeat protein